MIIRQININLEAIAPDKHDPSPTAFAAIFAKFFVTQKLSK